jgi:mono/diheme cytochrome c family protein
MPAWSQASGGPLTEEEIEALTLYILNWETGGLPEPVLAPTPTFTPRAAITLPAEVEGDPEQGSVLYTENCAVCHGPNGEGRVGATLAKSWPSIRADLQIKTTIERGVAGSAMPAWDQAYGGPLTQQEIGDIVAYISSWEAAVQPLEVIPTPTPSPSAFRGPLGVIVFVVAALALALVAIIGALTRRS